MNSKSPATGFRRLGDPGAPEGIRIPDLPLRRRTLYPAELLAHIGPFWALRGIIVPHFGKKVNGAGKSTEFFFPNSIY